MIKTALDMSPSPTLDLEYVVLGWEIQVKVSFGEIIRMGNYSKCRKV